MIIKVNGKNINITDKNARAYEKLNGLPVDDVAVKIYVSATYHGDADRNIAKLSENELSELLNRNIEMEVRGCGNDVFYEEA